ncbi:MAG: LysM domain-containing protein [Lachnospiraceae bacterium]|nr:LysM domain-containing protein [Lachnospiraceae bacterium]MDO5549625.1 LysM domain-containing protein [Lachnospiraceae bacterium]
MGELYEPYPKLPKNIRQIGERDDIVRVYLEDYVNTYLKRLFPAGGQDLRAGLLLGNVEDHGGVPYVFIDGALEMEQVTEEGEKVSFTEEAWKKAYQTMEEMFPKRTVQGWFLCGAPGCMLSPLNYWKQHSQYFSGKHKLMYLNSGLEGEEALYITSSDGFYKLRGHCIYYERNQMMQDYMVLRKDNRRVEAGGSDPVIRDFRRKMEQKKELANSQSHTIGFLKSMCGCLAILAMAGGVAAFNSAEKMKDMEAVMASVLPDADAVSMAGTPENGAVIIEEASGGVFPTAAPEEEDYAAAGPSVSSGAAAAGQAPAVQAGVSPGTGGNRVESRTGGEGSVDPAETGNAAGAEAPASTGNTAGAGNSSETQNPAESAAVPASAAVQKSSASARQLEPAPGQSVYVVQEGETLYGICFKFYQNLSKVDEICRINGLEDVNLVEAGRRLIMP